MEKVILTIEKDAEDLLVLVVDGVACEVSDELKDMILKELHGSLGGNFAREFDDMIIKAMNEINSCIKGSDLEDDGFPLPTIVAPNKAAKKKPLAKPKPKKEIPKKKPVKTVSKPKVKKK